MSNLVYRYFYKYDKNEKCYYIYMDENCKTFVARLKESIKNETLFDDLDDIVLIYKGEI